MDLLIYKGDEFFITGKLDISVFQIEENKYMYIPCKSGHQKHTIRNFIIGEIIRLFNVFKNEKQILQKATPKRVQKTFL
jgi:hypothetical protein